MPIDFSIPNNTFPWPRDGAPAIADTITYDQMNFNFWPEGVTPIDTIRFPQIELTLVDKDDRVHLEIEPFHPANLFSVPTMAWLYQKEGIELENLRAEDSQQVTMYLMQHREMRFVDEPRVEWTFELKTEWVAKYQRHDAFLHVKKPVHDLVREKRLFLRGEHMMEKNAMDILRPKTVTVEQHPYDYERDVFGGRLRVVKPVVWTAFNGKGILKTLKECQVQDLELQRGLKRKRATNDQGFPLDRPPKRLRSKHYLPSFLPSSKLLSLPIINSLLIPSEPCGLLPRCLPKDPQPVNTLSQKRKPRQFPRHNKSFIALTPAQETQLQLIDLYMKKIREKVYDLGEFETIPLLPEWVLTEGDLSEYMIRWGEERKVLVHMYTTALEKAGIDIDRLEPLPGSICTKETLALYLNDIGETDWSKKDEKGSDEASSMDAVEEQLSLTAPAPRPKDHSHCTHATGKYQMRALREPSDAYKDRHTKAEVQQWINTRAVVNGLKEKQGTRRGNPFEFFQWKKHNWTELRKESVLRWCSSFEEDWVIDGNTEDKYWGLAVKKEHALEDGAVLLRAGRGRRPVDATSCEKEADYHAEGRRLGVSIPIGMRRLTLGEEWTR